MPKMEVAFTESETLSIRSLLSIESVRVCPPPNRDDLQYSIYGSISFNDDPRTNVPLTLYDRPIEDPQKHILVDHPGFDFLFLSDGDSDRPLVAAPNTPIYLSMKLYEEKSSRDDDVIASVENFEFQAPLVDKIFKVEVPGSCGFMFEVSYAVVTGTRVQFEVRMDDVIGYFDKTLRSKKRDLAGNLILKKDTVWGHISARQCFGDDPVDKTTITLNYRYNIAPMNVTIGSTIDLDRRVVVAPVKPGQSLCIILTLCSIDSEVPNIIENFCRFLVTVVSREDLCSRIDDELVIVVPIEETSNDQPTFSKIIYGIKYVFTVSITFIN